MKGARAVELAMWRAAEHMHVQLEMSREARLKLHVQQVTWSASSIAARDGAQSTHSTRHC